MDTLRTRSCEWHFLGVVWDLFLQKGSAHAVVHLALLQGGVAGVPFSLISIIFFLREPLINGLNLLICYICSQSFHQIVVVLVLAILDARSLN